MAVHEPVCGQRGQVGLEIADELGQFLGPVRVPAQMLGEPVLLVLVGLVGPDSLVGGEHGQPRRPSRRRRPPRRRGKCRSHARPGARPSPVRIGAPVTTARTSERRKPRSGRASNDRTVRP